MRADEVGQRRWLEEEEELPRWREAQREAQLPRTALLPPVETLLGLRLSMGEKLQQDATFLQSAMEEGKLHRAAGSLAVAMPTCSSGRSKAMLRHRTFVRAQHVRSRTSCNSIKNRSGPETESIANESKTGPH